MALEGETISNPISIVYVIHTYTIHAKPTHQATNKKSMWVGEGIVQREPLHNLHMKWLPKTGCSPQRTERIHHTLRLLTIVLHSKGEKGQAHMFARHQC